jgi:hypothetical protein
MTPRGAEGAGDLDGFRKDFIQEFARSFARFDRGDHAENKLLHCATFCAMIGLRKTRHCQSIVGATCALSKCSFETDEVRQVLECAMVNINRKSEYMTGLDARQRALIAVCHIYIAQAILHDGFVDLPTYCREAWGGDLDETALFFERVLSVMKAWKNRVMVSAEEWANASTAFVALMGP